MTTLALKEKLYKAIDNIDDNSFLNAVYTILNEKAREHDYVLTDEQKTELDEQLHLHKAGKTKSYTLQEVRKMALTGRKR